MKFQILAFFFLVFSVSPRAFSVPPAEPLHDAGEALQQNTGGQAQVQTYAGLLRAIREVKAAAQNRIEQAVRQEKVREAWETGRLIDAHVLQHKERADYGKNVIVRLGADLGTDPTELYRMLQFAREYPILVPGQELTWSHYKALLAVNDRAAREDLAKKAAEEKWNRNRLREEIRKRRLFQDSKEIPATLPLRARKGELDTYRIVTVKGRLQVDLGFSNYFELSKEYREKFKEGDIVRVTSSAISIFKPATESLYPLQIFGYRATVLEVTDGDTFWALVDLGFGFTTRQRLRLRGLDAPEIESAEGKEAKAFLVSLLGNGAPVLIRTVRSDKYDRYLADVWTGTTYLNQELLDKGLAVQVSE